jgi:UDP-N-acetyl-2-amino-2-deoxyglucuronate dehydrogenase
MASAPHAQSLSDLADRVEVAAAFSPTETRRRDCAARWGFPVVDSANAIFDDVDIDAIFILTPPPTHLELVDRAADAGKHILLEKPLDVSIERAERLVEAAARAGVKLGVVLQHRFRPVSLALAAFVAEGRLGEIVGASARLSNWRPQSYYDQPGRGTKARDGGGVLLTQAIHTLDLLISLVGVPVEVAAYAATTAVHRMEMEDIAAGAIRFGNGAIGAVSATTSAYPGYADAIELIGTKGSARIEDTRLAAHFHDGSEIRLDDGALGGGAGADPMAFPHHHHHSLVADFLDAIESGREPKVTGREALKVHRLIDALLRSAASGRFECV